MVSEIQHKDTFSADERLTGKRGDMQHNASAVPTLRRSSYSSKSMCRIPSNLVRRCSEGRLTL